MRPTAFLFGDCFLAAGMKSAGIQLAWEGFRSFQKYQASCIKTLGPDEKYRPSTGASIPPYSEPSGPIGMFSAASTSRSCFQSYWATNWASAEGLPG